MFTSIFHWNTYYDALVNFCIILEEANLLWWNLVFLLKCTWLLWGSIHWIVLSFDGTLLDYELIISFSWLNCNSTSIGLYICAYSCVYNCPYIYPYIYVHIYMVLNLWDSSKYVPSVGSHMMTYTCNCLVILNALAIFLERKVTLQLECSWIGTC